MAIHAGTATREQRIEHAALNVQARSITPLHEDEGFPVYHAADLTQGPAIKYTAADLFPRLAAGVMAPAVVEMLDTAAAVIGVFGNHLDMLGAAQRMDADTKELYDHNEQAIRSEVPAMVPPAAADWHRNAAHGLYITAEDAAKDVYAMLTYHEDAEGMTDLLAALQEIHAARLAELAAQQAQ